MSEWPPAGCGAPSRRCESNLAWMLTSSFTSHKPPALFTNIDDAIPTRTQIGDHTGRRGQRLDARDTYHGLLRAADPLRADRRQCRHDTSVRCGDARAARTSSTHRGAHDSSIRDA